MALVNYAVILQSKEVLDLAKDFAALMIIADFDNIFAKSSKDTLVMEILNSENRDAYKDLFKIETTTSLDAMVEKNEPLEPDEISTLIEARKRKRYGAQRHQGFCNRFFKQSGWQ